MVPEEEAPICEFGVKFLRYAYYMNYRAMRPVERGSAEERRTHMAKGCLYCGLQLPETTDFCPQCGRPIEDAVRVESGVKMRRTHMAKGCLYCGLQLPDTADFCPQCGRPIERDSGIGRIPESEFDDLSKEMKGKDY